MRTNTNVAAYNAYRNLARSNSALASNLERLSSGFRINRSGDDAAGLVISQQLRAQVSGLRVAQRNAQDGVSVMQTAEGALNEVHSMLQRMRDLALNAANFGSLDPLAQTDAVRADQSEFKQIQLALNQLTQHAAFNSQTLLDGAYVKEFQVGAFAGDKITVSLATSMNAGAIGVWNISITHTDAASEALTAIDQGINTVSSTRAMLGAFQNRFESVINNLSNASENLAAAESRIRDTDMAAEMTDFTRHQILVQAGTAMLAQANQTPRAVLQLLR